MDTITGSRLRSADGEDIGEITDVIGADASMTPEWVAVKTGWFSQRLVPFAIVVEDEEHGEFVTAATLSEVKAAPKVPVHFEPNGHDLEQLCEHYRLRVTDA